MAYVRGLKVETDKYDSSRNSHDWSYVVCLERLTVLGGTFDLSDCRFYGFFLCWFSKYLRKKSSKRHATRI